MSGSLEHTLEGNHHSFLFSFFSPFILYFYLFPGSVDFVRDLKYLPRFSMSRKAVYKCSVITWIDLYTICYT